MGFTILLLSFSSSTNAQSEWYKYPANPVFQPGKTGEWDMAKIAHTVLFVDGQYKMWYRGFSDLVPGFYGVGYASSPDGIHWQKYEANPLEFKCEGTSWDTILHSFDIIKNDSLYLMWYAGKDKKTCTWSIGYAWSENGLSWTKLPEPVLEPGNDDDWADADIKGASVYFDGLRYQMWYNGYDSKNWIGKIGYATSGDGIHWEKHPANPVLDVGGPGTWDEHWISVYSVNFNGSYYEMWYDGFDKINTQAGYATSVDGVNWIKSADNPVLQVGELGYWDTWIARIPTVVYHDSIYRMWYYGHDYSRGNIGYATTSVVEARSWDTATINKPQTIVKVQILNRTEYINVDSLADILPGLSGIELANACNKLALAYSLNDYKKSLEYAQKALEISEKQDHPMGRAMALYSIGNSQYIMDNYSEALASQLSALWLFDSLDMQFEHGNLLAQIAGIHSYAGSHDLACRYYQQALNVFEQLNDTGFIINSLMFLGYSYLSYGDTAAAMKQFRNGLSRINANQHKWIKGWCYESIGLCYSGRNLDSALFYFQKANKIYNSAWPAKLNLLRTAEAYLSAGPDYYEEAERYFNKCFPILGTYWYHKARLYLSAAELYFLTGRYNKCKESLDIALDECQRLLDRQDYTMFAFLNRKLEFEVDLKHYMERIYRLKYRIDTALNNKDSAFAHFMLATQWKDSIYSEQNRRKTAMMQGTYETESSQNRIGMLQMDNEVKALKIRQNRIFLVTLTVFFAVITLTALFYIRQRRKRAAHERLIAEQKLLHKLELEKVEADKLKELDRMKSRFFDNLSHEFRTPLTLIMRPIEKVLSKTRDESDKKDLNVAQKYARSLQNLINNLLTLSRLESGKMQLRASEINIVKLVKGYFQAFESLALHNNITLNFYAEEEEINAYIDQEKFEQILNNLLSNAFKFTPQGGSISIKVGSRQLAIGSEFTPLSPPLRGESKSSPTLGGDRGGVIISISDTGPGIPPEHLPRIFDRFYQADINGMDPSQGTGIGLALAKELVGLHHGKIEVESEVGSGTTFRIYLPLGKQHLAEEEILGEKEKRTGGEEEADVSQQLAVDSWQSKSSEIENGDMKSSTIHHPPSITHEGDKPLLLIVEDNPDMRSYIREYFENEYAIIEAVDGTDGYEKAVEKIPDIIISDVMMPKMDGNEFCSKVKKDERSSHIPIILLTARASKEDRVEGLEKGADDFITKPFDGEELQVRVKNLVDQRKRIRKFLEEKIQNSQSASQIDLKDSGITSMDEQFLQKVIKIVKEQHSDPTFNAGAICKSIGLGRIQLNRKIKALTGQTTVSFIRTYRLNRAAELIKKKSATIAEIAYDVGFNSPSYFTECFREYFGQTPSDLYGNDPA